MSESALDGEPETAYYAANAGLVLLHPFFPHLFDVLGVLKSDDGERPELADPASAHRAVHLLQYLVDGRVDTPGPELALNKLLCGMPITDTLSSWVAPDQSELNLGEQLLRAAVNNWPAIKNTSTAGLRQTFLQREGRLVCADDHWHLTVQRKTLDILVDQIPWSFSVINHPWMEKPLHVTW
jgi:Contractile injection system tape measure protein